MKKLVPWEKGRRGQSALPSLQHLCGSEILHLKALCDPQILTQMRVSYEVIEWLDQGRPRLMHYRIQSYVFELYYSFISIISPICLYLDISINPSGFDTPKTSHERADSYSIYLPRSSSLPDYTDVSWCDTESPVGG